MIEQLDRENCDCGIFVDFYINFEAEDHDIFILKLNRYDIRGVPNNCFSSLLQKKLQYFNINRFNSNFPHIYRGIPRGFILAPLLLLIYIDDFHCAIKYCSVHHFIRNPLNGNNLAKKK